MFTARDSVISVFHSCLDQIRRLRAAVAAERQSNRIHAAALRHEADRKAAGVIEDFLSALIHLRRLQVAVSHWTDPRLDEMDAVDPGLFGHACAVIDWNVHTPAVKLLIPCWMILDRMGAASELPEPGALDGITGAIFDGLEMRTDARAHGSNQPFMEHTAALMHLPDLVDAG